MPDQPPTALAAPLSPNVSGPAVTTAQGPAANAAQVSPANAAQVSPANAVQGSPATAERGPAAPADLAPLRAEIDALDDAMHDLLMRRAAVVSRLAASGAKRDTGSFRPGREAAIMRRLLARHRGPLPPSAVLRVWREVIASSHAQQGNFAVAVAGGGDGAAAAANAAVTAALARGHFGLDTPLRLHPFAARALAALAAGEASVAVLPAPEDGEPAEHAWWTGLDPSRLRVVAALPFLRASEGRAAPGALVLSPLPPEPTARDRTLLRLQQPAGASRDSLFRALDAAGLPASRLIAVAEEPRAEERAAPRRVLAEVAGFVVPGDPRLPPLRAEVLGAFAEPETVA